jgi:hypothetical protein
MSLKAIFSTSLAFSGLIASASGNATPNSFNWTTCTFEEALRESHNVTFPFECSNFTVPLDYLDDKANKTINLQLSKIPAVNGDSKGTIFFNFGGPGLEARATLISQGEMLLTMTGGKYDLVAFDPRLAPPSRHFDRSRTA